MIQVILFVLLGIFIVIGGWQLVIWLVETSDKNKKYRAASSYALKRNKPLLVVGGPWGGRPARRWFNKPAHGAGDVCLDIGRRAIDGHPYGVVADVTHIPFSDKSFGSAFISHVLEHLPTTNEAKQALSELNRVAEAVFIVCPSRQSFVGWVIRDHHLWVWQKRNKTYLKQRGKLAGKRNISVETVVKDDC